MNTSTPKDADKTVKQPPSPPFQPMVLDGHKLPCYVKAAVYQSGQAAALAIKTTDLNLMADLLQDEVEAPLIRDMIRDKAAEDISHQFVAVVEQLLDGGASVGLATHDEEVATRCLEVLRERGIGPESGRYEFQCLMGVRSRFAAGLRDQGHPVRFWNEDRIYYSFICDMRQLISTFYNVTAATRDAKTVRKFKISEKIQVKLDCVIQHHPLAP